MTFSLSVKPLRDIFKNHNLQKVSAIKKFLKLKTIKLADKQLKPEINKSQSLKQTARLIIHPSTLEQDYPARLTLKSSAINEIRRLVPLKTVCLIQEIAFKSAN
jgi:hypothetical protein